MMALHGEIEIFQNIVNNMKQCEAEYLVNLYDTGRESLRIITKNLILNTSCDLFWF